MFNQAAKIWVKAGESKYLVRLSVYYSTGSGSKQTLLGRGYAVVMPCSRLQPCQTDSRPLAFVAWIVARAALTWVWFCLAGRTCVSFVWSSYIDMSDLKAGHGMKTFSVELEEEGSSVLEDNTFSEFTQLMSQVAIDQRCDRHCVVTVKHPKFSSCVACLSPPPPTVVQNAAVSRIAAVSRVRQEPRGPGCGHAGRWCRRVPCGRSATGRHWRSRRGLAQRHADAGGGVGGRRGRPGHWQGRRRAARPRQVQHPK